MQEKNTMGQQEDWELSEEYYKEETGKKELRLEDFLEAEEAPENQSGLGGANGVAGQLEEMAGRVKQVMELSGAGHRCLAWMCSRCVISWSVSSHFRKMTRWQWRGSSCWDRQGGVSGI